MDKFPSEEWKEQSQAEILTVEELRKAELLPKKPSNPEIELLNKEEQRPNTKNNELSNLSLNFNIAINRLLEKNFSLKHSRKRSSSLVRKLSSLIESETLTLSEAKVFCDAFIKPTEMASILANDKNLKKIFDSARGKIFKHLGDTEQEAVSGRLEGELISRLERRLNKYNV